MSRFIHPHSTCISQHVLLQYTCTLCTAPIYYCVYTCITCTRITCGAEGGGEEEEEEEEEEEVEEDEGEEEEEVVKPKHRVVDDVEVVPPAIPAADMEDEEVSNLCSGP